MAQLDLTALKTNIKSILDTANTTTASVNLSGSLDGPAIQSKVKRVLTVNPANIRVDSHLLPAVTCWIDGKELAQDTIAKTQATGLRKADITINVAGFVWYDSFTVDTKDPADDNCEQLMENIEEILRDNPTLSNSVTWAQPTDVAYHTFEEDEKNHYRVGILTLVATTWY